MALKSSSSSQKSSSAAKTTYKDTSGRTISQTAYNAQKAAGNDVSGFKQSSGGTTTQTQKPATQTQAQQPATQTSSAKKVSVTQQASAKEALSKATEAQKASYIASMKKAGYDTSWIDGSAPDTTMKQQPATQTQSQSTKTVSTKQQEALKAQLSSADKTKIESTKLALSKAGYDTSFFDGITGATTQDNVVKKDESFVQSGSSVISHPTPNGKVYDITKNEDGTYTTISKVTGEPIVKKTEAEMKSYLDSNNQKTGVEVTSPGETTVKGKQIEGEPIVYTADNGKQYSITKYTDGTASFVSQDPNTGNAVREFSSIEAAQAEIANKNQGPVSKYKTEYDQKKDEVNAQQAQYFENMNSEIAKADAEGDETYKSKLSILSSLSDSLTTTYNNIDSYIDDLETQSKSLFDQNVAIEASARAGQLAGKGYINSDQAAAAAEYSISDYKRNAELKKTEIYKTIAEKKIELEQAKQKAVADISNNQLATEDAKLAQINYIQNWYATAIGNLDSKVTSVKQFYDAQSASLDSITAQYAAANQQTIDADKTSSQLRDLQKTRALTSESDRTAYYIANTQDVNLHRFIYQAIGELQKRGTYMATKNIDAQFNAIIKAANALYKASLK